MYLVRLPAGAVDHQLSMGQAGSKEVAKEVVKAATRGATKGATKANLRAAAEVAQEAPFSVPSRPPPEAPSAHVPARRGASRVAPAVPASDLAVSQEMDANLIKAMYDLGPALKSMRSEAVRTATVKLVDPRQITPGQLTEPQITRIVGVSRQKAFDIKLTAEELGVPAEQLEKAIKYIAVPRIITKGESSDRSSILRAMVSEKMNPLALDPSRFLCVEQPNSDGSMQLIGFGQVRPLPGDASAFELASVWVSPEGRGKGIGSQLVSRLVAKFRDEQGEGAPLFLLTLRERGPFYTPVGFVEVDVRETPRVMQVEYTLGKVVTRLSGRGEDALICMRLAA